MSGDPALPMPARDAIIRLDADVFVSAATTWEIAIKQALGKLAFPVDRIEAMLEEAGFEPLAIQVAHTMRAGALPPLHHDPFDRLLIAQAQHEGMTLVSIDPQVRRYAVPTIG